MKILIIIALISLGHSNVNAQETQQKTAKPNVIIIFTDDQGYQDLGCYNSPLIKTPNLDKMASEGIRFTDFYVSNSVCSASRASLLTGRFPSRHGIGNAIFPGRGGLRAEEITIAEILKTVDYKTACFGKWHIGDTPGMLPLYQGFDEYFGIPYSNDMYIAPNQEFSEKVVFRDGYTLEKAKQDQNSGKPKELKGKCPLFEGNEIVEYPCDQSTLTERYFNRAINFINKAGDSPFFVYITPAMPHVPLHANEMFKNKSERGLYGDVVEEIDWNIGKLFKFLKEKGLDENTMVIFSSDNGPWLPYGKDGGSAIPLRDGKFSIFEGGIRLPCIMRWPNTWESGIESHQIVSTYDFLPTIAHYAEAKLPEIKLDGYNIASYLENTKSELSNQIYVIFRETSVAGIRKGKWKYLSQGGKKQILDANKNPYPPMLFNLDNDISETTNVYDEYPEVVKELKSELDRIDFKQILKKTKK